MPEDAFPANPSPDAALHQAFLALLTKRDEAERMQANVKEFAQKDSAFLEQQLAEWKGGFERLRFREGRILHALTGLRDAVKESGTMNHMKYDAIGIEVNAALSDPAPTEPETPKAPDRTGREKLTI